MNLDNLKLIKVNTEQILRVFVAVVACLLFVSCLFIDHLQVSKTFRDALEGLEELNQAFKSQ